MFCVMLDCAQKNPDLIGIIMKCDNCNTYVYFSLGKKHTKKKNNIFIKSVVLQHFGISLFIQPKQEVIFSLDLEYNLV